VRTMKGACKDNGKPHVGGITCVIVGILLHHLLNSSIYFFLTCLIADILSHTFFTWGVLEHPFGTW
jgi:hypothetical protein